ncbi:NPCBM/NEW2 domain-containing protein [Tautonia rosea]|uniref:NPCBM/NEW2 domain-containing protein n=1 Tax=Tautonia rosea TaxID=2728037 RepID=UPI001472E780|nr:NPCBM/NEW2 domain-containing protein [Tautonia rosea]
MWIATILVIGTSVLAGPFDDYSRSFDTEAIALEPLASERYGKEDAFLFESEGLRLRVNAKDEETGWKSPSNLRIVGNATIQVEMEVRSLPTPTQEDGVAVGLSVATQTLDQPDATLVRVTEPDGSIRYRVVNQPRNAPRQPSQMRMIAPGNNPAARDAKPPRPTFPAEGDSFRLIVQRDGSTLSYRVLDAASESPRDLGQMPLGNGDLIGLKVFALNRNGAESVDVLIKSVTVHADQLRGLGTAVRTIHGQVVYGEPIGLEDGSLQVGPARPEQSTAPTEAPSVTGSSTVEGNVARLEEVVIVERIAGPEEAPIRVEATLNGTIAAVRENNPPPPPPSAGNASAPSPEAASEAPVTPEPKAIIPLDELDVVRFERTVTLSGRFLGQPNVDLTGPHSATAENAKPSSEEHPAVGGDPEKDAPLPPPGTVVPRTTPTPSTSRSTQAPRAEPEPNGIRDLHLRLSGLRDAELTQIVASCQTDEGQSRWRLDTSGSTDWPLVLKRSGKRPHADLFLEPPAGDCNGKSFQINLTYADQQSASLTVKVDQSTDPAHVVDADLPANSTGYDVRVFLKDGQELSGTLTAIDEKSLILSLPWGASETIAIPLGRIRGVRVEVIDRIEPEGTFSERLDTRGAEDVLLARTRGGEIVAVAGIIEGMEGDRIRMIYQDQSRTVPLRLVEGIVLAEGPAPVDPEPDEPIARLSMTEDQALSGFWRAIDGTTWTIETVWGATLKVPASEVQSVRFQGTRMTYLSDLEPARVEQTPYFGRLIPWRRDESLRGGPLTINGQTFDRGLAVHSHCELTYDLNGRFSTFETLVGFDDTTRGLGRVDCRVFADDAEIFANPDLRAETPATTLRLSVAGAQTLRLVVDYGPDQDAGDRLIWANARLYRDPPEAP